MSEVHLHRHSRRVCTPTPATSLSCVLFHSFALSLSLSLPLSVSPSLSPSLSLSLGRDTGRGHVLALYRGTSFMRKRPPLGLYSAVPTGVPRS